MSIIWIPDSKFGWQWRAYSGRRYLGKVYRSTGHSFIASLPHGSVYATNSMRSAAHWLIKATES